MKLLTNLNLNNNQLLGAVVENLAIEPVGVKKGYLYFNTTTNRLMCYDGTKFVGADSLDYIVDAEDIVAAINASAFIIDDNNLSTRVNDAITHSHTSHNIADVTGLQTALDGKVDDSQVLTNVPAGAVFTDTVYTHPTTAGNKHIPTGGTVGQVLKNTASGTATWQNETDTIYVHPATHSISEVSGLQTALDGKVDDSQVLTDVPAGAVFTDTITSVNGKTGAIVKADITALGIPAQDTTYSTFTTAADGLVPKTTTSNTADYLRRDGSWATPPDTKYTLPVAGDSIGGVKSGTDITVDASGNVSVNDDSHNHVISNVDGLQSALDLKETITGSTSKANTAEANAKSYTDTAIASLVDTAPSTLDTLNELAAALGDDPNFATTMTNELAKKTDKFSQAIGNGVATSFELAHNLNSRDVVVSIRESGSPYAQVYTDVEMTTVNIITVKFAVAPTSGQYTVTVIG